MTQKKTKLIRYRIAPSSPNMTFRYGGHVFKFDKALKPIPLEIEEEDADTLLEMMDSPCRCHYRKPIHLFEEVRRT